MQPRFRIIHVLVPTPVLAAIAVACSDAPQTVTGGDPRFDAHFDPAFALSDAGDGGCIPTDAGDATWTSLYAQLFGPAGIAQCGDTSRSDSNGSSSCHHDATGVGAQSSGFICGDTQESCYQGITSPSAFFAGEQVVAKCDPAHSFVLQILRHNGTGIMPFFPTSVSFSDAQMASIAAWISAGAPDN